jgi:hypothetical protein
MHMTENQHPHNNPVHGRHTLTRNNLEFAGVVVYFFTLAVIFAMTIIVMMCQTGNQNEKSSIDQQPDLVASSADYR